MTPATTFYPARHAELTAAATRAARTAVRAGIATLLLTALTLATAAATLLTPLPAWPILLPFLLTAAVLRTYLQSRREHARLERLAGLYTRALARLDGTRPQSGHTGEAFRDPTHLYDRDLAILGPDSLFGLLATVRTGTGQRGLAHDLLHPQTRTETLARQQAIQELTPRTDLREQIHMLGDSDFHQLPATFFDAWLDTPPPTFHPALRPGLVILTAAYLLLTLAGLLHLAPWPILRPNILALLALQSVVAYAVRQRALPVLDASSRLANQMAIFRDGLALLEATAFQTPKLLALQAIPGTAVPRLARIERHFAIVEQRTKNIFLIVSLFLAAGTHTAISIAAWKRRNAAAMHTWLAAWAEFESLNALATYAYEHPENIYPEILPEGTPIFEATALAHPLLPATAVPNDIALNPSTSLYLISGSNMAGKSTLLRALGVNAVLALAGAPIRAATPARLTPLRVAASIALTDSLAEGKSKFLAEVERLHAILQLADSPTPVLFLIDEIFAGTNSSDRRVAAEAVARALIARHALGALSTHDLTLTAMATDPTLHATNVHMASPDPADPLAFDYRLKPGINPSTNALAILRLIGIAT